MTDPETIAKGLTKAQREALFRLDRNWRFIGLGNRPDKCRPVIERWNAPGLGFLYRLTPLGLAVREVLAKAPSTYNKPVCCCPTIINGGRDGP